MSAIKGEVAGENSIAVTGTATGGNSVGVVGKADKNGIQAEGGAKALVNKVVFEGRFIGPPQNEIETSH
jgi:hypothetical protein